MHIAIRTFRAYQSGNSTARKLVNVVVSANQLITGKFRGHRTMFHLHVILPSRERMYPQVVAERVRFSAETLLFLNSTFSEGCAIFCNDVQTIGRKHRITSARRRSVVASLGVYGAGSHNPRSDTARHLRYYPCIM